jgi:type II secretory pathway pseudopilin PulG
VWRPAAAAVPPVSQFWVVEKWQNCRKMSWAMSKHKAASGRGDAGFTLIDLLFVVSILCTLCTMALPSLMRARGAAQSASAIGTLRVVNSSQLSCAVTCGSGFYSPNFATLGIAPPSSITAFLPPELSSGTSFLKQGYSFNMTATPLSGAPPTCNGKPSGSSSPGYAITADPLDQVGNPQFFGSNADGTIYQNAATLAGLMPESGPSSAGIPIK